MKQFTLALALCACAGAAQAESGVFSIRQVFSEPDALAEVVAHARACRMGVVVLVDGGAPMPTPRRVAVWLSDRSPRWELSMKVANLDLPVLLAYLLTAPNGGVVDLRTTLRDPGDQAAAEAFFADLIELGRLPRAQASVRVGVWGEHVADADLHILGLPDVVDAEALAATQQRLGGVCLFVQDSGQESALA